MIKKQSQNFEIKIAPSFEDDTATLGVFFPLSNFFHEV